MAKRKEIPGEVGDRGGEARGERGWSGGGQRRIGVPQEHLRRRTRATRENAAARVSRKRWEDSSK